MTKPPSLLRYSILLAVVVSAPAGARGVTPYLPLNMSRDMERQIERVLILADKPVMRRPFAAATVFDALPKACAKDKALCERVERYLRLYMGDRGVTQLQGTAAFTEGDSARILPNSHGMPVDSSWQVAASAFYQPNDFALLSLGGIAYDGEVTPTGSMLSVGWDIAQLDIGYRDHWLSPLSDSSMLISTEAPTMASITLSNYEPISPLNLSYEVFLAKMSDQQDIRFFNTTTSGDPRLAGMQLAIEPASGYSVAVSRIFQYGGGARDAGFSQFVDALFKNSNKNDTSGESEFGNQVAALTSSILFPGAIPFAVHLEYAGEDNSYRGPYRLGSTSMSVGLDFPELWDRFDLSYEVSEWQQAWYVHHIYPLGLTNEDRVIGHWFGDSRIGDAGFGYSHSVALGMELSNGYARARYRMLKHADYSPIPYERGQEFVLSYATAWRDRPLSAELVVGEDVFGESYSRLGITMDLIAHRGSPQRSYSAVTDEDITEFFIDSGLNYTRVLERLSASLPMLWSNERTGYHVGFGVRRPVSERQDLGVRLEFDEIGGRSLISARAVDYRFRYNRHVALNGFFGVSRYQIFTLPAYGYYWGAGVQWTNAIPGWDLGLDWRMNDKLTRTKVLRTDPIQPEPGGIYVDSRGLSLYVSYRF